MKQVSKTDLRDARLADDDQAVLSSIDEILADVKAGKPVIIVDDEDRENEGDLIVAAEMASAENINFMAKEGRGLICLPMEESMVDRLGLELMGRGDNSRHRTAFTVSIEAKEGVTTGISAADRAKTIQVAIDPNSGPGDIATPGHVFPLRARNGGVLVRAGHTEAAVDLSLMAGFSGAGVICEIMNDDGTMSRLPDLVGFAQRHGLKIGTIADLIAYRRARECLVECIHDDIFTSEYGGEFQLKIYKNILQYAEHIVLIKGDIQNSAENPVMVRMHAVDVMNDVLGGKENSDLHQSMSMIAEEGAGVIVILREPNPYSLSQRLKSKRQKSDNQSPVLRDYGIGAQILKSIGVNHMILLTNSQKNIAGLEGYNLHIHGFQKIGE
ncbi:MAG: 3,4-dihydroxy-2-butanone-4-phosphate synthase [Alphaproteobacteria bacterium]